MRSDQLEVGQYYGLEVAGGDECVQVQLKSLEARYSSKVIVIVGTGDGNDAGIEVPISKMVSTWDEYLAENIEMTSTSAFSRVLWIPKKGEVVELVGTGTLEWTVVDISFREGEGWAVVQAEVFGRKQEQTVPITHLHRHYPTAPSSEELEAQFFDKGIAPLQWQPEAAVSALEPERIEPVRNLQPETVAGRLVFSESACDQFREMAWCKRGQEQARMRAEVGKWGYLGKMRHKRGFVRYIVRGRFEFTLNVDPTIVEGDLWVDKITDIRSEQAIAKFKRERRAADRRRRRMNADSVRNRQGASRGRRRRNRRRPSS